MNDAPEQQSNSTAPRRHAGPISRRLLAIGRDAKRGELTVGLLFDGLAAEGLGLTLLLLTLPALIPLPGPFGMLFGTLVALVTLQLMLGVDRLWLPDALHRRPLPARLLRKVVRGGLSWTALFERALREDRMAWLTGRRARMLLALPLLLMAITIVLPIPLGNVMPALALIAAATGLMVRDGVAVIAALVLAVIATIWTAILLHMGAAITTWLFGLLSGVPDMVRQMFTGM